MCPYGQFSAGGTDLCVNCSAANCSTCNSNGTLCTTCPINFGFDNGACNMCYMNQFS